MRQTPHTLFDYVCNQYPLNYKYIPEFLEFLVSLEYQDKKDE